MATELDLEIPSDVVEILLEFGLDAEFVVRSKTYGSAEVTSGKTTYGADPNVFAKASPPWPYGISYRSGVTATEGDAQTLVQSQDLGFSPRVGMLAIIDSLTWMITQVDPVKCGTLTAAFMLRIER